MKRVLKFVIVAVTLFVALILCNLFGKAIGVGIAADWPLIAAVFWLAVVELEIGAAEEALFRYLIMDLLLERRFGLNQKQSMVVSSLIFGAAHFVNHPHWLDALPQVAAATASGALLAYVYHRVGLWACIFLHFGLNLMITIWL